MLEELNLHLIQFITEEFIYQNPVSFRIKSLYRIELPFRYSSPPGFHASLLFPPIAQLSQHKRGKGGSWLIKERKWRLDRFLIDYCH